MTDKCRRRCLRSHPCRFRSKIKSYKDYCICQNRNNNRVRSSSTSRRRPHRLLRRSGKWSLCWNVPARNRSMFAVISTGGNLRACAWLAGRKRVCGRSASRFRLAGTNINSSWMENGCMIPMPAKMCPTFMARSTQSWRCSRENSSPLERKHQRKNAFYTRTFHPRTTTTYEYYTIQP